MLTTILPHPLIITFFYHNPLPPEDFGSVITVLSHVSQVQGIIVFGYIIFIIHNSRLIELRKSSKYELIAVFIFWISLILFFLNNILITFRFYPQAWRDDGFDFILIVIVFFFYFSAIIILLFHYIIVFPPHLLSPSLQLEYFKKLTLVFTSDDYLKVALPDPEPDHQLILMPAKPHHQLSSTAIEILILLLGNQNKELTMKDIQSQLRLKPVAITHYLRVLQNHKYIDQNEIETHSNSNTISIRSPGVEFLLSLYKNVYSYFGDLLSSWGDFYREQNYSDNEISSYLSRIQNIMDQSE